MEKKGGKMSSAKEKVWKVAENDRGSILNQAEAGAVAKVIKGRGGLSYSGENIRRFEEEFARYCGAKYAITVSSCTGALHIVTQILRLKAGDEIIATPQSFRATLLPVFARGVKVQFADIQPNTLNIDPATIYKKITRKTKAIFLVHYGGNPADMAPIIAISRRRGIVVVDDAAHAVGAEYQGRKIGNIGDITCFSFHSLKNMTSGGEGGMITTNNAEFAAEAKSLRTMGILGRSEKKKNQSIGHYPAPIPPLLDHSDRSYEEDYQTVEEWGTNYRMSEIQATIGRIQLKKLDGFNRMRRAIAERYRRGISGIEGFGLGETTENSKSVFHLYPVFIDRKVIKASQVEIIRFLEDIKKIQIILRYFPLHLTRYARFFGHRYGECPVCERIWFSEQLNLPISPAIGIKAVDYVIESLSEAAEKFKK